MTAEAQSAPAAGAARKPHRAGMGAITHAQGVAFRVWAPHADQVAITGSFNDWSKDGDPMASEGNGYWYADLAHAGIGDEYRYLIRSGGTELSRIDPYARQVTSSIGNAVIVDPEYDWQGDDFQMPPWNELVIYEMHVGTFHRPEDDAPGTFADAIAKFDHLRRLGINAIQIMPAMEFAGDISWGYNPAHIFAIESAYGGPAAFKDFVKAAHRTGFAVILDVVYNHFGPSDLDLWRFDGWSENDGGGIYFYNDGRRETPWGATRPDYGRAEVRQFIRDNALMWLEEYHVDGLRFDMTLYIRSVRGDEGDPGDALPDGWSLLQWLNREIAERFPGRLTIAEDLRNKAEVTAAAGEGGAGFGAQWDAEFVHPIRAVLIEGTDEARHMGTVAHALGHHYNGDAFQRVIYTESHDEVANGKARVPHEIAPGDPAHWAAQKRSTLGAALTLTAPGIPMLFQGQEFLQGEWFRDTVPLDWDLGETFHGILRLYRDLIRLRLNRAGASRGLCGRGLAIRHVNESDKVIAFHRWDQGGPGDDVVVVANFGNRTHQSYRIGLPREGLWRLRLNSDWQGYSDDFGNLASGDLTAAPGDYDGCPCHGEVSVAPYSVLIFSQDG
jgi:1,4-alpha-glucan branching enzyme